MLAKVFSCAIVGLEAEIVEVEVDIIRGAPAFNLVGLPDAAVRESRDRVHSAIKNSGFTFPGNKRITVNLAPADLRKEGPAYDLPIAIGVLAATQQIWSEKLADGFFLGELSLDGTARHTKGILPMTALARELGFSRVFVPAEDAGEAALLPDVEVFIFVTLLFSVSLSDAVALFSSPAWLSAQAEAMIVKAASSVTAGVSPSPVNFTPKVLVPAAMENMISEFST